MKRRTTILTAGLGLLCLLVDLTAADVPTLPPGVVNTQNPNDKPLSPQEALKKITLPEGFQVSLFAGEPDVMFAVDVSSSGERAIVERRRFRLAALIDQRAAR